MFDRTRCLIEAFSVIEHVLRQMRPQPLIIGIRQEREQPVRSSITIEHGQFFLGVDGRIRRQWLQASQWSWSFEPACQTAVSSFTWAPARAAYSSASLRRLPRKFRSVPIAGEAAATLGLFAKVERLGHRTHSQRGGSPLQGLSVAGAEGSLPAISGLYRFYVRYATQFPLRPEREGDSDRFRQALY